MENGAHVIGAVRIKYGDVYTILSGVLGANCSPKGL